LKLLKNTELISKELIYDHVSVFSPYIYANKWCACYYSARDFTPFDMKFKNQNKYLISFYLSSLISVAILILLATAKSSSMPESEITNKDLYISISGSVLFLTALSISIFLSIKLRKNIEVALKHRIMANLFLAIYAFAFLVMLVKDQIQNS
jgi:hypothetical protein